MKTPLVIFGTGDIAQLAHYYFSNDSDFQVVAFTVDAAFITSSEFLGLPVVPFEEIDTHYPPADNRLFIALSYSKLNEVRKEKYLAARALGYKLASYVSSHATVLNDNQIGDNCFILEDNTIQPFVRIGNNVTLWSGNHIGHHSTIKDHCFIASHVVISGGVEIQEMCFIGVNATLRDHIKVGEKCVIGAGVLLLKDAEAEGLYIGAPSERSPVPSTRLKKI
ncbi:transferase [Pseudomonas taiwanensis]|uniref:acetyltransferase n=1 Tax=Pseudomonas taiwanensis TaxID=470150 RepID=UPI0015BB4D17|nr:acetyltransferase [Pseudomonas taiwanensis]NWL76373.1 transferase [Pseudomonas taiwanensis]